MEARHFWVVGGDARHRDLAKLLAGDGYQVHTYALGSGAGGTGVIREESLGQLGKADCVILPLPVSRPAGRLFAPLWEEPVAMEAVLDAMRPGQMAVGGQMGEEVVRALRARALRWRDYFTREELAVANAVPTAEGALQLAMENLPITLHGCRALILGYGRIGRALAHRLRGLGANVAVAARRQEQLAWAEADGCLDRQLGKPESWLHGHDVIFNTVPAVLLDEQRLRELERDCLVIDLASEPGGVDYPAAERLGIRAIWGRSLPGRVAPLSAARAIQQSIYHILQEVPE